MSKIKILMLSKEKNVFCDYAEALLKSCLKTDEFISVRGTVGDPINEELYCIKPDYLISFLSPWIVKQELLDSARLAALNFHPGSPMYPGTGCYNFALYEGSERYGVTCHHMKAKVDTGKIIMTSYFDITPFETVDSLKLKSMNHLLYCFEKVVSCIALGKPLPESDEVWQRKPFTRREMYELFEIDPTKHDEAELNRRIRAASYPSCKGAYVIVGGKKFYYPECEGKPTVE